MLSPSIGTILPGLGSNKEKHSGRELTGDNMLGTANTKNTQSIDKSTSKQKAQKGKIPNQSQQAKKSQKHSSEWRIVNPGSLGSSPNLNFGSEMTNFSNLTMGFKGFHARSSMESILKSSGIRNQFGVKDQMEGSPVKESVLPFESTPEKGCDEEMVLAHRSYSSDR